MDNMELNLEQMNEVSGGNNEGGYGYKPREKSGCFIYRIKSGDNLTKIAKRFGTTVDAIYNLNRDKIQDPDLIKIGWKLIIPVTEIK